jgi:hypothetical protein
MKYKNAISILTVATLVMASGTTFLRIFFSDGSGLTEYYSIQDIITLIIGVPLLLVSLFLYRKTSIKGKLLLAGTLGYFFITYLFHTAICGYDLMLLFSSLIALTSFSRWCSLLLHL